MLALAHCRAAVAKHERAPVSARKTCVMLERSCVTASPQLACGRAAGGAVGRPDAGCVGGRTDPAGPCAEKLVIAARTAPSTPATARPLASLRYPPGLCAIESPPSDVDFRHTFDGCPARDVPREARRVEKETAGTRAPARHAYRSVSPVTAGKDCVQLVPVCGRNGTRSFARDGGLH